MVLIALSLKPSSHTKDAVGGDVDIEVTWFEVISTEKLQGDGPGYDTVAFIQYCKERIRIEEPAGCDPFDLPNTTDVSLYGKKDGAVELAETENEVDGPSGEEFVDCIRGGAQQELLERRLGRGDECGRIVRVHGQNFATYRSLSRIIKYVRLLL